MGQRNMRAIEDSFVLIDRIYDRLSHAMTCAENMPIDCPKVVDALERARDELDQFSTDIDEDAGYIAEGIMWEVNR